MEYVLAAVLGLVAGAVAAIGVLAVVLLKFKQKVEAELGPLEDLKNAAKMASAMGTMFGGVQQPVVTTAQRPKDLGFKKYSSPENTSEDDGAEF